MSRVRMTSRGPGPDHHTPGLVSGLTKRPETERVHRGRDPSPLLRVPSTLATCGVASSQPARRYLEHVQTGVPSAGGRLQSKRGARTASSTDALGMSEAVGRRGIVFVPSG